VEVSPDKPPEPETADVHDKRESWQMTLAEWRQLRDKLRERGDEEGLRAIGGLGTDYAHRYRVEQALKAGKPVPKEVLSDYAELATSQDVRQKELSDE
jgi:hypothetical protein